jgi:hypothetical protein
MTLHFDTVFRILFALFLTAGYLIMAFLKGLFHEQAPCWKGIFAVSGLIIYIIAIATILMAHKNNSRPTWELALAFLAPFILYALLFFSFNWESKELWRFTGAFQFISVAGGFFLGIVLSPLIATVIGSVTGKEALDFTVFGLRFIDSLGLKAFAVVLAAGMITALIFFSSVLVVEIRGISMVKKVIFYLILLNSTSLFAYYTYTMTRFHIGLK